MLQRSFLKNSSISYSHFLQPKKTHIHHLTEARDCVDIEFFRRSISLHYQHVYASKKCQNWIYRLTFFCFGFLFLILSTIIFFKTVNFACSMYFKDSILVKNGVNALCFLLAGSSFGLGYKIHPEKEAIHFLMGKVERELQHPSKNLQLEFHAIISNLVHDWKPSHQTIWIKKALNPL